MTDGTSNVAVSGGPVNSAGVTITFQGTYAGQAITLFADSQLTGVFNPAAIVETITAGGIPIGPPTLISSVPNSSEAIAGNNAKVRVVIDGSNVPGGSADVGFVINASNTILRGLIIEGFTVGVLVPYPHQTSAT